MLYNMMLFLVTREITFFYYILTILSLHLFTNLAQFVIIKEFFIPNFSFLHKNIFHFAHLFSLISVTFFIFAFFKNSIGILSRRFFILASSLTIPLALFGIWSDSSYVDLFMQVNTTIFCLYLLHWSTYQTFIKKLKLARYFSVAWTFIIISWVLNFLKIDGLIVNNIINDGFILIGAGLECLLLSLALADRIRTLTKERNEAFSKLTLIEERNKIFRQVSHDIRSPLSALTMLTDRLSSLPEESRILLRSSVNRINDIANQLLSRSKDSNTQYHYDKIFWTHIISWML